MRESQIRKVHRKRRASTRARIIRALNVLENRGQRVTISSVAEVAGVTRATIYNYPDLKDRIEARRREQDDAMRRLGSKMRAEAREKARLKSEVARLRKEVEFQGRLLRWESGPVIDDDDVPSRLT